MKPESRFIKKVHDALHPDVYREKMFNPLRGGTPDCYYMGYSGELWVEYKWEAKMPRWCLSKGALTSLQLAWLMRAWDRGKRPLVVVGSPTGSVVLVDPAQWLNGTDRDKAQFLTNRDIATEIERRCGLEHSLSLPLDQSTCTR